LNRQQLQTLKANSSFVRCARGRSIRGEKFPWLITVVVANEKAKRTFANLSGDTFAMQDK
jgi:hypothetical protein